uniref:Ionotropic receptor 31a n=1 Tax=Heliconius melpomene rosina TaxID=171916 RepID=A0A140G9I1_HELME|nr:ionotropic receptor 31a [Heliconius melpomene rosina]
MLPTKVIADLFHYRTISSVIVLTCWPYFDRAKFIREINKYNIPVTISCDPAILDVVDPYKLQGVLYIPSPKILEHKIKQKYFSNWYKWMILNNTIPHFIQNARYDADILLLKPSPTYNNSSLETEDITIYDVYTHPRDDASVFLWAHWDLHAGLQVLFDKERIDRRRNLSKYPLKIAAPLGSYSNNTYNGGFLEYLMDMSIRERDSGVRIGYSSSSLIIEILNATEILLPTLLWSTEIHNSSMILELKYGSSELSGGVLRLMKERFEKLDYIMPIWPFHVGFTYLAERESSSNMFLEPFTVNVWWCCLILFLILAAAQKVTAKSKEEKEGAYIATLATFLQQDASAVPKGISGRWNFLVLSISAMLIHAYYTSAIVSALMSTGRSGPDSLRSLGDSKYAIASEDYDYMRYLMFDVKTNRDDLEYLKKRKLTPKFYQDVHAGVKLIQTGSTAYHTEYNQLYPHLKTFTDDQLCKLQYVDTVPEVLSWITTTKRGQWTNTFKVAGAWLQETGLAHRLVSRVRIKPPPCRAALLAERVNIHDIMPVLICTFAGAVISLILLGLELFVSKFKGKWLKKSSSDSIEVFDVDDPIY